MPKFITDPQTFALETALAWLSDNRRKTYNAQLFTDALLSGQVSPEYIRELAALLQQAVESNQQAALYIKALRAKGTRAERRFPMPEMEDE